MSKPSQPSSSAGKNRQENNNVNQNIKMLYSTICDGGKYSNKEPFHHDKKIDFSV